MNPSIHTGSKIVENHGEECRASILHARVDLSRLMVHIQQVEENRNMKNIRAGNMSRLIRIFQGRVLLKSGISPGLRRDSPAKEG